MSQSINSFTESVVEQAALAWLEGLGYATLYGAQIAPGELFAERNNYGQVVLENRLRQALQKLNPQASSGALDEAFRKLTVLDLPSLEGNNHLFHKYIVNGVPVDQKRSDGSIGGDLIRVLDYEEPENNEFVAINQFTVVEDQNNRRPDVVLFVNGLPLAVIELKNPADEQAEIWGAYEQLQVYKSQIPSLFTYNEALVISDGTSARIGTLTGSREWFLPWRTIEGEEPADDRLTQLQVLLEGVFDKRRFLDLIRYFTVFEDVGGGELSKKMAGYHQYHAVNVAFDSTVKATAAGGEKRVGVVWHTQGSGKSLTMAFYAGRVALHPKMANPTIVVITDRNDLDDQLYGTFARCHELLGQPPIQAESRSHMRELLRTSSGGIIFTTVQKFFLIEGEDQHPLLTDRRNVVVIADEAHRSQYEFGRKADSISGKIRDGFAHHLRVALPNASFIGFTGTPIELRDRNTRTVFGDYISIYDIERAVSDKATVPIYYESRLAKLELKESEKPKLDLEFEEVTEDEEQDEKEKLKSKWAQLEKLVGTEKRLAIIARDIVNHFEARLAAMDGKAMIVCMSRRICMDLHDAIKKLRPEWYDYKNQKGSMKVVMTGKITEGERVLEHSRTKEQRELLAKRFKDPKDPFKVVIVRDMWLTGFDVPCLHTMYVDKPMRGHGLMQAIARVNRVYKDKPGGLVVDYLGLAHELKSALATYTESGGKGETTLNQDKAVAVMMEKHEVCCAIFHGFDWSIWKIGKPRERVSLLPAAQNHVLAQEDGKNRLAQAVTELSKAFALSVPHEKAMAIRDDLSFFQTVKSVLVKSAIVDRRSPEEIDHAIRQIISRAVVSDEVVDIFAAAGLKKPDISILSDKFLDEVRGMPQKNLAVETLRKLMEGEIHARKKKNLVLARSFAEMLEKAIRRYQNRAIEAVEVIDELIKIAKEMRDADGRGERLGLSDEELAFYDALETNDSAVKVLGDAKLKTIARELVAAVRANVTIDWTIRENVKAQLRVLVKRILRKHGYPPDKQEKATLTVLEQAEIFSFERSKSV